MARTKREGGTTGTRAPAYPFPPTGEWVLFIFLLNLLFAGRPVPAGCTRAHTGKHPTRPHTGTTRPPARTRTTRTHTHAPHTRMGASRARGHIRARSHPRLAHPRTHLPACAVGALACAPQHASPCPRSRSPPLQHDGGAHATRGRHDGHTRPLRRAPANDSPLPTQTGSTRTARRACPHDPTPTAWAAARGSTTSSRAARMQRQGTHAPTLNSYGLKSQTRPLQMQCMLNPQY